LFKFQTTIRLSDTDATGRIYYTTQLRLASAAFEEWMEQLGYGISKVFAQGEVGFPVVHTENEFRSAMKLGDRITYHVFIDRVGETSFTWSYLAMNEQKQEVGFGKTVQVCVDQKMERKRAIPEFFSKVLQQQLRFSPTAFEQSQNI
jgi:YbgC/YbaW family acyl-CoA thioester hydrolase